MQISTAFQTEVVDGRYLNVTSPGKPGRIVIELGSDGFGVEMWPDFADQPIVETWATYQEMGNEP